MSDYIFMRVQHVRGKHSSVFLPIRSFTFSAAWRFHAVFHFHPMKTITEIFQQHSELAVFLTLAVGFFIGKLRIRILSSWRNAGDTLCRDDRRPDGCPYRPVVKIIFFDLFYLPQVIKLGRSFFTGSRKMLFRSCCLPSSFAPLA